jgi:hypothetical protein
MRNAGGTGSTAAGSVVARVDARAGWWAGGGADDEHPQRAASGSRRRIAAIVQAALPVRQTPIPDDTRADDPTGSTSAGLAHGSLSHEQASIPGQNGLDGV